MAQAAAQTHTATHCMAYQASHAVDATLQGVAEAGTVVAAQMDAWLLSDLTIRAELAAKALVSWLANHDHGGDRIQLSLRYSLNLRELVVAAHDGGTMLPVFAAGDTLRAELAKANDLFNGASYANGGRIVWFVLRRRPPWRVRYTWLVPEGMTHPRHTEQRCDTREAAEQAWTWATKSPHHSDGLDLQAVHIQGPDDGGHWQPVLSDKHR